MLHCQFTGFIWSKIVKEFDINYVFPKKGVDFLLMEVLLQGEGRNRRGLWRCILLAVFWTIWMERNNRIFEGKEESKELIWEKVKYLASLWASGLETFKWLSVSYILYNWQAIVL